MKEYLRQFYNEGLAKIFYTKPVNYLNKKIKNKKLVKILTSLLKVIYTIFILALAGYILYRKLK